MKILLLLHTIISLSLGIKVYSQDSILINFKPNSPGDYELLMRDILNQNGFKVRINYSKEPQRIHAYSLDYDVSHASYGDVMRDFTLELYKGNKLEKSLQKTVSFFNRGNTDGKQLRKGLQELFSRDFEFEDKNQKKKVTYFNIQFSVSKIDSSKYFIEARGAGIRTLEEVKKAFIEKSLQFLDGFDYDLKNEEYSYSAPGPYNSQHTGHRVFGIIIGNNSKMIKKLDTKNREDENLNPSQ